MFSGFCGSKAIPSNDFAIRMPSIRICNLVSMTAYHVFQAYHPTNFLGRNDEVFLELGNEFAESGSPCAVRCSLEIYSIMFVSDFYPRKTPWLFRHVGFGMG
jgi:hypothetical protein